MPDFSFGKLLFLAIIIAVVWYGFKYVQRVEEVRRVLRREMARRRQGASQPEPRPLKAEDLAKCARCGAYVPAQSTSRCERADCPWGR
jgi:uncharacterized protein